MRSPTVVITLLDAIAELEFYVSYKQEDIKPEVKPCTAEVNSKLQGSIQGLVLNVCEQHEICMSGSLAWASSNRWKMLHLCEVKFLFFITASCSCPFLYESVLHIVVNRTIP